MLNEYVRWHWTKQRKHTEDMAWMVLKAVGPDKDRKPLRHCLLFIDRSAKPGVKGHQKWDWDGLLGGMKGLIDALTATHKHGIGLIEDDSTECILATPTIYPRICDEGEPERTRIRIVEVEDAQTCGDEMF